MSVWVDLFTWSGVVVRPTIVAAVLAMAWLGLRRAGFEGRARTRAWLVVAVPLIAWFATVTALGRAGAFLPRPTGPVPAIPFAILIPLAVGLVLLLRSRIHAAVAEAMPVSWLIGIQVYRIFGATFVAHWGAGNLPGVFALPAGLGDMLVGALAIPVALHVQARGRGWQPTAIAWNLLGIVDLLNAVTLGFLSAPGRFQLLALDHPNLLVGTYPLVMIPAFAVPLSLMLHGLSLAQLRRAARRDAAGPARPDGRPSFQ
jgi:hypothetical protein